MPDGDRVHPRLAYHYQKLYKQICEGQSDYEALAREGMRGMIKDIGKYGNEPITFINQAATHLVKGRPQGTPLHIAAIDWDQESRAIDKLSQQFCGNARGIELAVKACKDFLYEIRYELQYGTYVPPTLFEIEITKKYLWNIYRADCEENIVIPSPRYMVVDKEIMSARLTQMRPYVMQQFENIANQIVKSGNVNLLHLPRNPKPKQEVPLDFDLSQLVG